MKKKTPTIEYGVANLCSTILNQKIIFHKLRITSLTESAIDAEIPEDAESVQYSVYRAQQQINEQLLQAVSANNIKKVQQLLKQGADINYSDTHRITPLYLAASKGLLQIVSFLIIRGADINQQSIFGNTPLHGATLQSSEEKLEVARELIMRGADVNAQNSLLQTPLHFHRHNSVEVYRSIAKMLIRAGAELHIIDSRGHEPLDGLEKNIADELKLFTITSRVNRD